MIELDVAPNGAVTIPGEPNRRTEIKLSVGDAIRLKSPDNRTAVVTACESSKSSCAHCVFSVFSQDVHAKAVAGYHCPHQGHSSFALCYYIDDAAIGTGYFTTMEDLI